MIFPRCLPANINRDFPFLTFNTKSSRGIISTIKFQLGKFQAQISVGRKRREKKSTKKALKQKLAESFQWNKTNNWFYQAEKFFARFLSTALDGRLQLEIQELFTAVIFILYVHNSTRVFVLQTERQTTQIRTFKINDNVKDFFFLFSCYLLTRMKCLIRAEKPFSNQNSARGTFQTSF